MENDTFWSEIGSGFGEQRGTPHLEYPGVPPFLHGQPIKKEMRICLQCIYLVSKAGCSKANSETALIAVSSKLSREVE